MPTVCPCRSRLVETARRCSIEVLVAYDVSTDTSDGRTRLRRVAKICEGYGQRVQKSVFECLVTGGEYEQLKHKLKLAISEEEDSLRFYRLQEPRERFLFVVGRRLALDLHDPLVV